MFTYFLKYLISFLQAFFHVKLKFVWELNSILFKINHVQTSTSELLGEKCILHDWERLYVCCSSGCIWQDASRRDKRKQSLGRLMEYLQENISRKKQSRVRNLCGQRSVGGRTVKLKKLRIFINFTFFFLLILFYKCWWYDKIEG